MDSDTKITQGKLKHTTLELFLTHRSEGVDGNTFVHGYDSKGSFMYLLHRDQSGNELFYGPEMQAVYMSHFIPDDK